MDLKFHDIPNTVLGAVTSAVSLGVFMLNVHVSGGREMLRQAVKGATLVKPKPLLIGVTVLTSLSSHDLKELGHHDSAERVVLNYAKIAKEEGLDGVVCSVHEVQEIKKMCRKNFITVTPGIRIEDNSRQDQKRTATLKEAIQSGTDYMVLGRSITESPNLLEKLSCFI